jgi:hypothetical protein
VHDLATERVQTRPRRAHRTTVGSGGDDDRAGAPHATVGGGHPGVTEAFEASDVLPELGIQTVVHAVAIQVLHDLVASGVSRP